MSAQHDEVDGGPLMFAVLLVFVVGMAAGWAASVVWGWL